MILLLGERLAHRVNGTRIYLARDDLNHDPVLYEAVVNAAYSENTRVEFLTLRPGTKLIPDGEGFLLAPP